MQNDATIHASYLLGQASTTSGFVAAINEEDNYRRIWTRDSAMCGLAALTTGDPGLIETFKNSIEIILRHQHPAGFIPSNVTIDEKSVSYGNSVGRVDNHAWIIISACNYAFVTNNTEWLLKFEYHFEKCFLLMEAWEFNGRGLMYIPQSADWADEYIHHGYILFNQLLRLWALRCATKMFYNEKWNIQRDRIEKAITEYFCRDNSFYSIQNERQLKDLNVPYWWMGFNTSTAYHQFDLQANALGLLLQIGTDEQQQSVVTYIKNMFHQCHFLLPSFYPAINSSDHGFEDLQNNYAFRFRNKPNEFHNGGSWSVWNGLAALAISKYDANLSKQISDAIVEACKQNEWEFNECHHSISHQPIGVPKCAWSAAGLLLSVTTSFSSKLIF